MASQEKVESAGQSTQNTQYDQIGTKYNAVKLLPAAEPEVPSVKAALGDITGKTCLDLACGTGKFTALLASLGAKSVHGYDISSTMIDGAKATYPASSNPKLTFAVADCSIPGSLRHDEKFDIVFAGWFLNYAGTETELTNMFRVIQTNLKEGGGKFVGITTNVSDPRMREHKPNWYGLDVVVLDPSYVAPDSKKEVGIKARVVVNGDTPFHFDVFQFRKDVYERCAAEAGLQLRWKDLVFPDDERKESGYWDDFAVSGTFVVVEAVRI
ncbi:S-adenosyl-L-methionine-dependent methyltransferase [Pyrenochaeta sp. MPI-SDFR-AT-0127]|nr:S-adenosyl-L-methionine-dependent methyltransferase [Pyrenochaeta sp. MPI-SDFR-AT-0127]